jgi:hypothetical protein
MSLDLSNEATFALHGQLMIPSCDPHEVERELCKGDHPGFHIEEVDPMFFTIYGGRQTFTGGRSVQLVGFHQGWADRIAVDQFGGRSHCRMHPGIFRNLLEEFWPIARRSMERGIHLACLFGSQIYQCDHIVPVYMGQKGYIIRQPEHYPSKGRFDSNAWFAIPC